MTDGNYLDPRTFRDQYHRILKKAGIGHKTFHALRHTFATRALESNAHVKIVSEILGHASLAATQVYTHTSFEQLKKIYKQNWGILGGMVFNMELD